jgi:hypothetical protein
LNLNSHVLGSFSLAYNLSSARGDGASSACPGLGVFFFGGGQINIGSFSNYTPINVGTVDVFDPMHFAAKQSAPPLYVCSCILSYFLHLFLSHAVVTAL